MARPTRDDDARPDPDALLALEGRAGHGRLKIFLGAAPGVGKTYAMLQAARRLAEDGHKVLIGLVETHGRAETEALVAGLDLLPRRMIAHRGHALQEFDLDAALARRPALIVVDELAHSNAPGSRHPKRWQDVQELLDAGIDVWTALNIQHLESLADVVATITGITVRETLPDTVLANADLVLVDITPDELISRLKAGKVYLPETAARATQNFFTPGNLTALRELALRQTADRVEGQMSALRRQKAGDATWEVAERLLVCIGAERGAENLVRKASRLATSLNASWIALHLTRPDQSGETPDIAGALHLADSLGGDVRRLASTDFVADLTTLARRENVTQILIGRRRGGTLARLFRRSLSGELVAQAQGFGVLVVPVTNDAPEPRRPWLPASGLARDAALALATTALATGFGLSLDRIAPLPNLSMIFLLSVLACATSLGTRSAVLSAALSFLAYNFFFIEPVHTFTIAKPHELLSLLIYLAVAILAGSLTGRVRDQAMSALARSRTTQALFEFSRKLSAASNREAVLLATVSQIHALTGGRAVLLVPDEAALDVQAAWPPDELTDPAELGAARWALEKAEPAGWKTGTLPNVRYRFQPLSTPRGVVAVLGYAPPEPGADIGAEETRLLASIADQAAIALDRVDLVGEAVKIAALQENENIRDALLTSLSHDLRTPLASITGAVSSLRELGDLTAGQKRDLLRTIDHEAGRLGRFVANLLDMSRIEAGAVKVKRDWVDVADAIRGAVDRLQKSQPESRTKISLAADLGFVRGDQELLMQVIYNLLDNAHKYAGEGEVSTHARNEGDAVVIRVTDDGPGIKPADLERVFEKFYRAGGADRRKPGTGLGLSICRGLVQAMGGTITAESPASRRRGTRMVVRLPLAKLPAGDA